MPLGPHLNLTKDVRLNNFPCFQSHCGPARGLKTAPVEFDNSDVPWVWHASYSASMNPKQEYIDGTINYLQYYLRHAHIEHIHSIVVHSGAVVGREPSEILSGMVNFAKNLRLGKTRIAIELGANLCEFNANPYYLAMACQGQIGWCLDLAHTFAAGVRWADLQKIIAEYPPIVAHINFPGSDFASGRDIHGWRSTPQIVKVGDKYIERHNDYISLMTKHYDDTIKLLSTLNIPLIVEGSGFPHSNPTTEYNYIKDILS